MAVVHLVLAAAAAMSTPSAPEPHSRGVNLYIGDLSAVMGYVPRTDGMSAVEAERARVRGHLLFAHDILASVDTSGWPAPLREARATNLERLRVYAEAGQFPHNDDHADFYRPTFVDNAGTICAVGALFAADRGRDAAVRIASTQKYAFVQQMTGDAELRVWQETSGLSVTELGLIQPTYSDQPEVHEAVWTPFGLLDRVQIAPPRASATMEMGSSNRYDTTSVTLHMQASTPCDCKFGGYGTLPLSIMVAPDPGTLGIAAAGGVSPRDTSRTSLGTADIGVTFGKETWVGSQKVYRLGMLLPTATREQPRLLASAHVGDSVLELPKTMGVRISESWLTRWQNLPDSWFGSNAEHAMRLDLGLDIAAEYANSVHERIVHVLPRVGVGSQVAKKYATFSVETALSVDPFVDLEPNLRWSAGITGRLVRRDGNGWFLQPALSLATVRTPDGWGATLALDIAASGKPRG
ncbi:MAG: hypothetical protein HOV81_01250 [Kofleriaceae bacterium]|nr:hypothetical protein [Kofleriaceae bacterium]